MQPKGSERGQSIVIVALAFLGILAFVGLAIDVSFFYVRAAQFTAAIDAATTAGAIELRENASEEAAYLRAAQFLNVNGWPVDTAVHVDTDYSFTEMSVPQFTLTVVWPIELHFMQLFGFDAIEVTRSATAALVARPEVFTPTGFEWGVVRKANQFTFGPQHCTKHGDPIAPLWADNGTANPYYRMPELDGVHQYRIRVGQRYLDRYGSRVLVELFDPDTFNNLADTSIAIEHSDAFQEIDAGAPLSTASCTVPTSGASCILVSNEIMDGGELGSKPYHNPFWFVRVDEGWSTSQACPAGPDQSNPVSPVATRFELSYFDMATGVPIRTPLAQYTTHSDDAAATDLQWVAPGVDGFTGADGSNFGSFSVDVSAIPTDASGFRHIYVDVTPLNGFSKNVFDIWARPPDGAYGAVEWQLEDDVNARNLQILNELYAEPSNKYDIPGLDVFALGRLPINTYPPAAWGSVDFTLVPIDQELQVASAYANLFDYDNSGRSVEFAVHVSTGFGEPDIVDYGERPITCGALSCDNSWATMTVSDDLDFGLLTASYPAGANPSSLDYAGQPEAHLWSFVLTSGVPVLTR